MSDLISRQDAINALEAKKDKTAKGDIACFYNTIIQNDIDALKGLQKKLKYSGESICIYCTTDDCVGCIYEPMEGCGEQNG